MTWTGCHGALVFPHELPRCGAGLRSDLGQNQISPSRSVPESALPARRRQLQRGVTVMVHDREPLHHYGLLFHLAWSKAVAERPRCLSQSSSAPSTCSDPPCSIPPTCLYTTPKEGGIHLCSVGLLLSSNHGERERERTPTLLCQLVFALLLCLTCRHPALFHLLGSSCRSLLEAEEPLSQPTGKVTAGNKPKPFGSSLFSFQARLA